MVETRACPKCSADVELGHRFCGHCGHPIDPEAFKLRGAALVRIHGGGADGARYDLKTGEQTIGRTSGHIAFPDDPFISPQHAKLTYDGQKLTVEDLNSENGVFVRINTSKPLGIGEQFLAGEELLVLEEIGLSDSFVDADETYFFGSVQPATGIRIRQILEGGFSGGGVMARGSMVTIGREGVDIEFPDDRFISGRHCALEFTPKGYSLADLGSRNGTFIRIQTINTLENGDFLFIGRQLLRVEIGAQRKAVSHAEESA